LKAFSETLYQPLSRSIGPLAGHPRLPSSQQPDAKQCGEYGAYMILDNGSRGRTDLAGRDGSLPFCASFRALLIVLHGSSKHEMLAAQRKVIPRRGSLLAETSSFLSVVDAIPSCRIPQF
jgi:hypothetical protein